MIKYKLLAIDLDGTLLSKFKHISKANFTSLKAYADQGGIPIITTGRSIVSAEKYAKTIARYTGTKTEYVIAFNGAYIKDISNEQVYESKIPHNIAIELKEFALKNKLVLWTYTKYSTEHRAVYVTKSFANLIIWFGKGINLLKLKNDIADLSAYKINIMSMNKKRISKALTELQEKYKNKLTFSHSHPRLIEINLKNINKGYGINFVAKKLKIKQENIAAIGDSNNDLPSFTAAALKISVKTKSSLLRESATYYLDYKRNAVANAINEYILSGTDAEIKLVASDLDGTLLRNGTKKIDLVTKETIEKLIDKYNKTFVVCTGRSIDDTLIVANYFKVRNHKNLFAICVNGGCIYDVANKRYLFEKVMDPSKAQQVIDIFHTFQNDMTRQKQMAIEAFVDYDNDSLIKNKKQIHYLLNKEFIYNYYLSRHPGMLKNFWAPREHKPIDSNMPLNRIMKFIMHFESLEDKARMAATMEKYKYDYEISSSSKHNIEIMPLNVSKGKALERLCHYLNINIKETMPIGDEKNDISMLSLSPHSVTFQSSSESVRQSAGHVLNDETSVIVAKAIETYVFKE